MIGKTGKISTDKPFHVKIEFGSQSYKLSLTQGDEIDITESSTESASYLGEIAKSL